VNLLSYTNCASIQASQDLTIKEDFRTRLPPQGPRRVVGGLCLADYDFAGQGTRGRYRIIYWVLQPQMSVCSAAPDAEGPMSSLRPVATPGPSTGAKNAATAVPSSWRSRMKGIILGMGKDRDPRRGRGLRAPGNLPGSDGIIPDSEPGSFP